MKKIITLLITMFSINVYANCNIYLQYETVFKENERGTVFDVVSNHLNNNGHTIVGNLEKADAVLKISHAPILQNQKFIYHTTLKYMDTLGAIISFSGRGSIISESLKAALAPMEKCQ